MTRPPEHAQHQRERQARGKASCSGGAEPPQPRHLERGRVRLEREAEIAAAPGRRGRSGTARGPAGRGAGAWSVRRPAPGVRCASRKMSTGFPVSRSTTKVTVGDQQQGQRQQRQDPEDDASYAGSGHRLDRQAGQVDAGRSTAAGTCPRRRRSRPPSLVHAIEARQADQDTWTGSPRAGSPPCGDRRATAPRGRWSSGPRRTGARTRRSNHDGAAPALRVPDVGEIRVAQAVPADHVDRPDLERALPLHVDAALHDLHRSRSRPTPFSMPATALQMSTSDAYLPDWVTIGSGLPKSNVTSFSRARALIRVEGPGLHGRVVAEGAGGQQLAVQQLAAALQHLACRMAALSTA